ncbi:hypothetical protein PGTUg99_016417 [Puccinia graminis f. sp. tritici]|uniref:Uncharacterized protein n=1 Tax=Puccinia graminis f. sp. tritici TaxID=56615 RepID=A0A5B0RFH8_PUCGR|nr:hypothetical protein PGTUg99_016417 [Puccinia graminis f. sp. tritici]
MRYLCLRSNMVQNPCIFLSQWFPPCHSNISENTEIRIGSPIVSSWLDFLTPFNPTEPSRFWHLTKSSYPNTALRQRAPLVPSDLRSVATVVLALTPWRNDPLLQCAASSKQANPVKL